MCVINRPVVRVSATQIYASPSQDGTKQLTVYANKVNTRTANTMILPVPYPDTIKFHDLSAYPTFFADLEKCFVSTAPETYSGNGLTKSLGKQNYRTDSAPLDIVRVGSYRASIVPSTEDFDRLDPELALTPEVQTMLTEHYMSIQGAPVGFIICRLVTGDHGYHPFAYSHRRTTKLFIPTLHFHAHDSKSWVSNSHGNDWDHTVYTANTLLNTHHIDSMKFKGSSNCVAWRHLPNELQVESVDQPLCRYRITGRHDNCDLEPEVVSGVSNDGVSKDMYYYPKSGESPKARPRASIFDHLVSYWWGIPIPDSRYAR